MSGSMIIKETFDINLAFNTVTDINTLTNNDSGIYLFLNSNNEVIYVGRTLTMRRRMREHFINKRNNTTYFIKEVARVEACVIDEPDFDLLEAYEKVIVNRLKPKYNKKNYYPSSLSEKSLFTVKYLLKNTKYTHQKISEIVGCAKSTVTDINTGKTYKHITLPEDFKPEPA
jgi:excinuclease UvrABC nuclease subunit